MCSTSFARETLNSGVFPFTYSQNLPYGATHPVNSFPEPRPTPERVLYIAVGTLRGGKEAWCRMAAALPPGAEVILFMGDPDPENTKVFRECCGAHGVPLVDVWHAGEPENWGDLLNFRDDKWFERFPPYRGADPKRPETVTWIDHPSRMVKACRDCHRNFLGRIHPGHTDNGSGLLLVYRHLVAQKLATLNQSYYTRLVFTRTDFLYACAERLPQPNDRIYAVEGESYYGISDRHTVYPWSMAQTALNVTAWLAHASRSELCLDPNCAGGAPFLEQNETKYNNLETLLALYFTKMKLPVSRYPRVQFVVQRNRKLDATKTRTGSHVPELENLGLLAKYMSEFVDAKATCASQPALPGFAALGADDKGEGRAE